MSSSESHSQGDPAGWVPFVVIPDTPSVMVTVTDSLFRQVNQAMGTIETTVPPGIYRIEQRFGGQVDRRFVEVGPEPFVERLPLPFIPTPTPVEGTATSHTVHHDAAVRWSLEPTYGGGVPNLMVLLRSLRRGRQFYPLALEVAAEDGTAVDGGEDGWRTAAGQEWSAWSRQLPPGGYRLRLRQPSGDGLPLAQALWVPEGWTTLVFVSNGPHGPEPQYSSIQMVRHGDGWNPADRPIALALEAALSGLRQGIDLVSQEQLSSMLHSKHVDLFLGIVGAHALLLNPSPDIRWLGRIVDNLAHHAPGHPDIAALRTLLNEPSEPVASPPMLAASYRLLLEADATRPGFLVDGSAAENVAEHLVERGVWTTWLEQEARPGGALARDARGERSRQEPGPARDTGAADPVGRVQRYVHEIATLEGTDVEAVLRSIPSGELCRRTGLPHKTVERAVEGLRSPPKE
ncbi:hypothetical protein ACFY3G_43085 [Streptomyces phaeochromogenes]|uniref:hypothetical protein n=1 Tax=Streptomyces phaeochromogenes TaxID=1923 RepID=UPI0036A02448